MSVNLKIEINKLKQLVLNSYD